MRLDWSQPLGYETEMHQIYHDLVVSRAVQMIGAAQSLKSVTHSGLKGSLREVFVRDLLEPLLPPQYIIGTGQIISAYGQTSGQTDIVVCDRRVLPPLLFDRFQGIFPIETVLATIEVKSRIDATELEMAHKAAAKIACFAHAPPVGKVTHDEKHEIEHVLNFVFAFDTDLALNGKTELERYAELYKDDEPPIRAICVVDRGFWCRADNEWHEYTCSGPNGEVVGMVAALVNACQRVAGTRLQPNIRDYIDTAMRPLP